MLYLFSSGYRPQYANTIFKTLCYPSGMINRHSYRCSGENNHVSPSADNGLRQLKSGDNVIIIIVDRNNNGYRYYPVRRAKLVSYRFENNNVFIFVKLDEFIFPRDIKQTENDLIRSCPDLPFLNGNADNTDDGSYVTLGDSIIKGDGSPPNFWEESRDGIDVWEKIVKSVNSIATLHYEKDGKNYNPFFMRFDVIKENEEKLAITNREQESQYLISPKCRYRLKVYGSNLSGVGWPQPKVKIILKKNNDINTQRMVDFSIQTGEAIYDLDVIDKADIGCDIEISISDDNYYWGVQAQIRFVYKKTFIHKILIWVLFPTIFIIASFAVNHYDEIAGMSLREILLFVFDDPLSLAFYAMQIGSIIGITHFNNGNKIF